MSKYYPLAHSSWDEQELAAIVKVIDSDYFTMGPEVAKFEQQFADYHSVDYAVMVNSGSSANLIAVAAAVLNPQVALNPGDEVIVPALGWSTTYFPLHQYGLKLVLVDIDPDTLNIDCQKAEAAISTKTRAVMAVNILGNPCHYSALTAICERHELLLLEDNCESLGAKYDGQMTGTFGVLGTSSFFFSHHMQTMEGGMITTNDKGLYQYCMSLRSHGWLRDLPAINHVCNKLGDVFYDTFRFALPGYNVRPLEMSGAVGQVQLTKLHDMLAVRRNNAETFVALFGDNPHVSIQKATGESSWFGFSLLFANEDLRAAFIRLASASIEMRPVLAGNFLRHPVADKLQCRGFGDLSAADAIHDCGLLIGNHPVDLTEKLHLAYEIMAQVLP